MDDDRIQQDLLLGLEGGDVQALGRAFKALLVEVMPLVARFERAPVGELDERVREVVSRLVFPETGRRSKLLVTDAELDRSGTARGHRRTVVRSFLLDEWRKRQTRREYEQACAASVSPDDIRAARRRRRHHQAPAAEDVGVRSGAVSSDQTDASDAADVTLARQLLVRHLPSLNIEYRVAVALEEGFDVGPLLDELATATGEPVDRLRERVAALRHDDHDACVRVLYPEDRHPDLTRARESYRKRHERGLKQLVDRIREDAS